MDFDVKIRRMSSPDATLEEVLKSVRFQTGEGNTFVSWTLSGDEIVLKYRSP